MQDLLPAFYSKIHKTHELDKNSDENKSVERGQNLQVKTFSTDKENPISIVLFLAISPNSWTKSFVKMTWDKYY